MKEIMNKSLFNLNIYDFKDKLKWELHLRVKHLLVLAPIPFVFV